MSAPNLNAVVKVDGRHVTVDFDLPFMAGDPCVTPNHAELTKVSSQPDVVIRLHTNLRHIDIHAEGAWYSASHSQMHGTKQYLPDMAAYLDYWLKEKDRTYLEAQLPELRRLFPDAHARINARHVELLQTEIVATKSALGASVVATTQKVMELETALSKATGLPQP